MSSPIESARDQLKLLETEEKLIGKLDAARDAAHGQDVDSKEYRAFVKAEQALVDHRSDMNAHLGGAAGGLAVGGDAFQSTDGDAPAGTDPASAGPDLPPADPPAAPPEQG